MEDQNKTVIEILNLAKLHSKFARSHKEGSRKAIRENWSESALYYTLSKLYVIDEHEAENYKKLATTSYLNFLDQVEHKFKEKNQTNIKRYEEVFNEQSERIVELALDNQALKKKLSELSEQ
jgi:hypothetical protein